MNLIGKLFNDAPSISNPLVKDNVESITIEIGSRTSIFRGGKKCKAKVFFSKENTQAQHEIFDDDFNSLMEKLKAFSDSL